MQKNIKTSIILFFLQILPILDVITSICSKTNSYLVSVGMIVKGLFLFYLIIFVLFKSKSHYKKNSIIFLIFLFLFSIIYVTSKNDLTGIQMLFDEFINLFKFLFLPVTFLGLLNYFDENKNLVNSLKSILKTNIVLYSLLIVIPYITNTDFSAYDRINVGSSGWFYSANEISAILVMLFPFLYIEMEKRKYNILFTIITLLAVMLTGTKVGSIGIILTMLFLTIYKFKLNKIKDIFTHFCLIIIAALVSVMMFSTVDQKYEAIEKENGMSNQIIIIEENESLINWHNFLEKHRLENIFFKIFSGRDAFFISIYDIYKASPVNEKLFGIGFSNRPSINNSNIEKMIESDILDILFRFGIIGFLLIIIPFVVTFKKILNNNQKENIKYVFTIILIICISTISGHVLLSPAVAIYLVLLMMLIFMNENNKVVGESSQYERIRI